MKLKDISELRDLYVGKTFNKLTITDILRSGKNWVCRCKCECGVECEKNLTKVISGHTKTCGGHVHKLEQASRLSQLYKEHPEIGKRAGEKISLWYKDEENKPVIQERSDNHRKWWDEHGEQREFQSDRMIKKFLKNRQSADYSNLIQIIHPKYVDDLLSGKIKRDNIVETKCPLCNKYGEHKFHDLFRIASNSLKYSHALLCSDCQNEKTSHYEIEIANYINSFCNNECIKNDRSVLNGKELDLYYPEKKIAIEFNGDYWHSDAHKSDDYHYNKFIECYNRGITLISIFESEWNSNKDAIKSYIKDLFNGIENKLSYKTDSAINLNYPPIKFDISRYYVEKAFYSIGHRKVYTCGYAVEN
jgi:hypothetical protein